MENFFVYFSSKKKKKTTKILFEQRKKSKEEQAKTNKQGARSKKFHLEMLYEKQNIQWKHYSNMLNLRRVYNTA